MRKVPPSSADVKEDGLDNAEEARLRELVFGKGDETFLGSFGSEAQQHTHRRRQQDLETWFDSSTALIGGQERGEAKGEQQKLQPFWVEGVTGEGGILDGTGATSPGSRDDAVPGRVLSKGSAWVDEDDARLKVSRPCCFWRIATVHPKLCYVCTVDLLSSLRAFVSIRPIHPGGIALPGYEIFSNGTEYLENVDL